MTYLRKRSRRFWLPFGTAVAICGVVAMLTAGAVGASAKATPIKIGFISTCKGPFAPFYDATLLGGAIAMIDMPVSSRCHCRVVPRQPSESRP